MSKLDAVTATIDARILSKVDRIFDASPKTILNELIQNARRAGSTCITLRLEKLEQQTRVTFEDDGGGIENPAVILHLGGVGEWSESTYKDEDPAGMGVFSLSVFDAVNIESVGWSADLTPEIFTGRVAMQPRANDRKVGTSITWVWGVDSMRLAAAFESAVKHSGISAARLIVDGKEVAVELCPFLPRTGKVVDFPEGYTIEVEVTHPYRYRGYRTGNFIHLNFKGCLLVESWVPPAMQHVEFTVMVDVEKVGDLQLTLPARASLKHNSARDLLMARIELAVFERLAEKHKGEHTLSYSAYARAMSLGVDIGEADFQRSLHSLGDFYPAGRKTALNCVLAPKSLTCRASLRAWYDQDGGHPYLLATDPDYAGYSWYDSLRRVVAVIVCVNGVDIEAEEFFESTCRYRLPDACGVEVEDHVGVVETLQLHFKMSDESVVVVSPKALITCSSTQSFFDMGDYTLLCTAGSVTVGDVVDMVVDVMFSGEDSDDEDAAEEFRKDAEVYFTERMISAHEAEILQLRQYIKSAPWSVRRMAWSVTCAGSGDIPVITECKGEMSHYAVAIIAYEDGTTYVQQITSDSPITEAAVKASLAHDIKATIAVINSDQIQTKHI